jgi:hypothetical protein
MNVFGYSTDGPFNAADPQTPWKKPYPKGRVGIKLRLAGGDVCDPLLKRRAPGVPEDAKLDWFNSLPALLLRFATKRACIPYIALGAGRFGWYCGGKIYGMDLDWYKKWTPAEDVYDGSNAICFTMRFTTRREQ